MSNRLEIENETIHGLASRRRFMKTSWNRLYIMYRPRRALPRSTPRSTWSSRSVTRRPFLMNELQLWDEGVSTISRHRDAVVRRRRRSPAPI